MTPALILGSSTEESKANTQVTLDLLQWLGFTINWEMSVLVPTQSLTFLGLSIDSQTPSLSLPEKNILDIQNRCQSLICIPTPSVTLAAHFNNKRALRTLKNCLDWEYRRPRITNFAHEASSKNPKHVRGCHVTPRNEQIGNDKTELKW